MYEVLNLKRLSPQTDWVLLLHCLQSAESVFVLFQFFVNKKWDKMNNGEKSTSTLSAHIIYIPNRISVHFLRTLNSVRTRIFESKKTLHNPISFPYSPWGPYVLLDCRRLRDKLQPSGEFGSRDGENRTKLLQSSIYILLDCIVWVPINKTFCASRKSGSGRSWVVLSERSPKCDMCDFLCYRVSFHSYAVRRWHISQMFQFLFGSRF